jgi:hypothetical protein
MELTPGDASISLAWVSELLFHFIEGRMFVDSDKGPGSPSTSRNDKVPQKRAFSVKWQGLECSRGGRDL